VNRNSACFVRDEAWRRYHGALEINHVPLRPRGEGAAQELPLRSREPKAGTEARNFTAAQGQLKQPLIANDRSRHKHEAEVRDQMTA